MGSIRNLFVALLALTPIGPAAGQTTGAVPHEVLMVAPRDGGVRRWQVAAAPGARALVDPAGSAVGARHPLGAVLTNLGCLEEKGSVWCEVRPLHGGPRGFVAAQDLAFVHGPDGIVAMGVNDSAKRAKRKRFDVVSEIPCAQERGQALAPCPIGISRSDGGDATAAVTFPAGFTRLLFFMHGEFISAAATMSGAGRDTDWEQVDGVHKIRADDQRFEIPDALIFGG